MRIFSRWGKTLKWLLNHPPISTIQLGQNPPCDYCGSVTGTSIYYIGYFCICCECQKKAFNAVLLKGKKRG